MNNRYKSLIAVMLSALCSLMVACGNDEFVLSNTFVNSRTFAEFTKTTPMEIATFRLDSVLTSAQKTIWVGKAHYPLIGDVCSESFMKMSQLSGNAWGLKERFDSVCVDFRHTGAYQGDTMKAITIDVRRLAQPLRFAEREEYFYNNRTFRDSISIGSHRFRPMPHSHPHVHFRVDDNFGKELIEFFRTHTAQSDAVTATEYQRFLGGIKIVAGDDAQNLIALSVDSFRITVHSHLRGMEELRQRRSITVVETDKQFNRIWTENVEEPFDKLTHVSKSVTEGETNLRSVMFEGLGYYTRINLGDLGECFSRNTTSHIVKAILKLYPERGMYDKHNFPSSFRLFDIGKGNSFNSPVVTQRGAYTQGYLYYDPLDENNVYYYADITYYLNTKLAQGYGDQHIGMALAWGTSQSPTNYNFMVFRGNGYRKYNSRIEIYYYNYDREDI